MATLDQPQQASTPDVLFKQADTNDCVLAAAVSDSDIDAPDDNEPIDNARAFELRIATSHDAEHAQERAATELLVADFVSPLDVPLVSCGAFHEIELEDDVHHLVPPELFVEEHELVTGTAKDVPVRAGLTDLCDVARVPERHRGGESLTGELNSMRTCCCTDFPGTCTKMPSVAAFEMQLVQTSKTRVIVITLRTVTVMGRKRRHTFLHSLCGQPREQRHAL